MSTAELTRHFHSSREEVFAAWTDPEMLRQWYCPNPGLAVTFTGTVAAGEAYALSMGEGYTVRGTYLVVEEPHLLEFTWQWDTEGEPSVVRVEIDSTEDGTTRLRLTHSDLPTDADATGHGEGWDLSLNRLAILLSLPNPQSS